jgi:hypothetical protein
MQHDPDGRPAATVSDYRFGPVSGLTILSAPPSHADSGTVAVWHARRTLR